jgi:hypothetical protein
MIEPLMATMLGVVTTDARCAPALLQRALARVTDVTFNAITRRRRVLDQRLRVRARQRRERRDDRRARPRCSSSALRASASRSPSASSAAAKGRPSW